MTKPQAIKDFYENDELIAITKELTDALRSNKTVDWQRKDSARAKIRMLIHNKFVEKYMYIAKNTFSHYFVLFANQLFNVGKKRVRPDKNTNGMSCIRGIRKKTNK